MAWFERLRKRMLGIIGYRRRDVSVSVPPKTVRDRSHQLRNELTKVQARLKEFEQKNRKIVGWAHDLRSKELGQ